MSVIDGTPVAAGGTGRRAELRTAVALVFQQPRLAADPRFTLADIIAEPLRATPPPGRTARPNSPRSWGSPRTCSPAARTRCPTASSSAPASPARSRCAARYLICDETTAMLDASTQAHLVARIEAYREAAGAGVLAISHDTDLLARWCGGKGRVLAWPPRSGRVPRPAASG